jgi:hypothetical protein
LNRAEKNWKIFLCPVQKPCEKGIFLVREKSRIRKSDYRSPAWRKKSGLLPDPETPHPKA